MAHAVEDSRTAGQCWFDLQGLVRNSVEVMGLDVDVNVDVKSDAVLQESEEKEDECLRWVRGMLAGFGLFISGIEIQGYVILREQGESRSPGQVWGRMRQGERESGEFGVKGKPRDDWHLRGSDKWWINALAYMAKIIPVLGFQSCNGISLTLSTHHHRSLELRARAVASSWCGDW